MISGSLRPSPWVYGFFPLLVATVADLSFLLRKGLGELTKLALGPLMEKLLTCGGSAAELRRDDAALGEVSERYLGK